MDYQLHSENWGGVLAFPAMAAENLPDIDGDFIKTLIFILSSPKKASDKQISDALHIDISRVDEALSYWIAKGILSDKKPVKSAVSKPSPDMISSHELADMRKNNQQAAFLFEGAEQIYGRPLQSMERRMILYIFEYTLLPVDVILMIIDYCVKIGKSTPRYIQKVSEDWADKEINTHQKAEEKIHSLLLQNEHEHLIRNCFGIHNRRISVKESGYITQWFEEYHMPISLIELAYEKCVNATGELSFPYIHTILSGWHKKGYQTPQEVAQKDTKKKRAPKKSPSYDLEELEQKGLFLSEAKE